MSVEQTQQAAQSEATKAKELEDSASQLMLRAQADRDEAQKAREADLESTKIADFEASASRNEQIAQDERTKAEQHRKEEARLNAEVQSLIKEQEERAKKERDEAENKLKIKEVIKDGLLS